MKKTNKYRVSFAAHPEWDAIFEIILTEKSTGAFQYGNRTMVAVYRNGEFYSCYDTRYTVDIVSTFDRWCEDLIRGMIDPANQPIIEKLSD